jgi:hypothetical protein
METRLVFTLVAIAVATTAVISFSTFNSDPESLFLTDFGPTDSVFVPVAKAGPALDQRDVAQIMRVRIVETGHNNELVFGSFSRIGFVADSSSDFLLESVPSEDKKPFYRFVKASLETKENMLANPTFLDIKIDIFSGDYDLINTLSYEKCFVNDYFIHSVDSRGKIPFIEGYQGIEIREVTKFSCNSFHLIIDE